ncbi:hypothetical protein J41TS12_21740 [Paenibacillus antibioticophila]|uniref:Uncharacterized protein n=1 Tax=Paenibacillus antibioticophila TaxID=1274374 RepID=A0A919XTJ8_9BACL|nr:hypothetical protein [Paenibacillus antibioticophila]GIO37313.1 hypothetical protein J41TS12_21740 [Paenibacillus antibioticophila]
MFRKITISLMSLILIFPMLVVSASANDFDEIEPGVFINKLSEEQISEVNGLNTLQRTDKINTEYLGRIVEELTLYKTEEEMQADGTINKYEYYHVKYKDSKEASLVQEQISSNKAINSNISPMGFNNEEGDFRLVTTFEPLVEQTKFDSVSKNLYSNLAAKTYEKYFSLLSGKFISNYIIGYFSSEMVSDLIGGLEGRGDATAYFRLAKKTGQIYHNGSFKSYFVAYQQEFYWKHETITYNKDGSVKRASTMYYIPQTSGVSYKPIHWIYSHYFNDNTKIAEVTQYQYGVEPNRSVPINDYLAYEGYRNDWSTIGTMSY